MLPQWAESFRTMHIIMSESKERTPKLGKRLLTKGAVYVAAVAVWVGIWQLAAMRVGTEFILPSPVATLKTLWYLLGKPEFYIASLGSMLRIIGGFTAGAAAGALLAALGYFFPVTEILFSPLLKVVRATPVASFILIVVLWIPSSVVPVFISFLMVLPIVYGNVLAGFRSTDPGLREAAVMYSFSAPKKLVLMYIPTALPYFGAACMTSLGLAWKAGIAAEVLCVTRDSIGNYLYTSKLYMESAELFAWTLTVILLSILLEEAVKLIAKGGKRITGRRYGRNNSRKHI